MKVLVIGAGGVGSSIANIASRRNFLTSMVVADFDEKRAESAVNRLSDPRIRSARVDASKIESVRELIGKTSPDLVINAVDPRFVMPIFIACEEEKANYLDMAMSLTRPDPIDPFNKTGVKFGDEQFARAASWSENFALLGMGIEPGLSNIFAK